MDPAGQNSTVGGILKLIEYEPMQSSKEVDTVQYYTSLFICLFIRIHMEFFLFLFFKSVLTVSLIYIALLTSHSTSGDC